MAGLERFLKCGTVHLVANGNSWQRKLRSAVLVLLLVTLPFLLHWRLFAPNSADRGSFPHGDFAVQFYAFAHYQATRFMQGEIPLWSPGAYSGFPFLADVQAATFYPPRLLTILLASPWGFPYVALELEAVLHFSLVALGMFLLGRRLFAHDGVAFLSALIFTFGGYLTSYPSQQLAILESAAWLPWAVLAVDRAITDRRAVSRRSLLAAVPLALAVLAGHPQTAMLVFYTVIAYALWRVPRLQTVRALAVALSLAVGLAAVQLLPSVEYMRLSVRASGTYDEMAAGLPVVDVIQMILPGVVSGDSVLYVGVLPLLLVGAALFLQPARPVRFWLAMAVASLLLAFGGQAFLHSLFYILVPGWSLFRGQERVAFLFSFSLSILAGYGTLALLEQKGQKLLAFARGSGRFVLLLLAAVLVFFLGLLSDGLLPESAFYWPLASAAFVAIVGALAWVLLLWWATRERQVPVFLAFSALIISFDLFTVGWRHNFSALPSTAHEAIPAAAAAIRSDADGEEPGRVFNEFRLDGNYGVQFGLEDIWGASPLRLARYHELVASLVQHRLWPMLDVRYAVTWAEALPVPSEIIYQEPSGSETTYVHRLAPSPRAWLVYEVERLEAGAVITRLADPDFDLYRTAIVELDFSLPPAPVTADSRAEIVARSPESLTLAVDTPADALLVLSEIYYPGWEAAVDGEFAKVIRADYVLRAVPVPAGKHTVEMHYDPWTFKAGAAVSLLSLGALILGRVLLSRR